ncbi:MAG: TatD family hydrolase [Armatimonadetes bacterium]|nr:TatD family hydrolase [Armatimonadota bacterium]
MTRDETVKGFDFHCHIDLHPDPAALIARCDQERIAVLAVTTTARAWPQNRLWMQDSRYVHAAVGLHPELVAEGYAEIDMLEKYIGESRLVGEVGLDGSPQHRSSYERQKDVFARALAASQRYGGRVVSVHSRRAARDTVSLIKGHTAPEDVICILHWFSGSVAEAVRAGDTGCYFSINPAMLTADRGRTLIESLPRDRILTETDSPLMKAGHNCSIPLETARMVAELAVLLSEKPTSMWEIVRSNSLRVFRFAGISFEECT